jgi:hypothetical protein
VLSAVGFTVRKSANNLIRVQHITQNSMMSMYPFEKIQKVHPQKVKGRKILHIVTKEQKTQFFCPFVVEKFSFMNFLVTFTTDSKLESSCLFYLYPYCIFGEKKHITDTNICKL